MAQESTVIIHVNICQIALPSLVSSGNDLGSGHLLSCSLAHSQKPNDFLTSGRLRRWMGTREVPTSEHSLHFQGNLGEWVTSSTPSEPQVRFQLLLIWIRAQSHSHLNLNWTLALILGISKAVVKSRDFVSEGLDFNPSFPLPCGRTAQ